MITDVFPAMALAVEPSAPDVMKAPPRDPRLPLITRGFVGLIVWQGLLLSGVTLLAFFVGMRWYGTGGEGLRHAVTITFMTLALAQIAHTFTARSQTHSVFAAGVFTNGWLWGAVLVCLFLQAAAVYVPLLQRVLNTVPLSTADWALVAACSLAPVAIVELVKVVQRQIRMVRAARQPSITFNTNP